MQAAAAAAEGFGRASAGNSRFGSRFGPIRNPGAPDAGGSRFAVLPIQSPDQPASARPCQQRCAYRRRHTPAHPPAADAPASGPQPTQAAHRSAGVVRGPAVARHRQLAWWPAPRPTWLIRPTASRPGPPDSRSSIRLSPGVGHPGHRWPDGLPPASRCSEGGAPACNPLPPGTAGDTDPLSNPRAAASRFRAKARARHPRFCGAAGGTAGWAGVLGGLRSSIRKVPVQPFIFVVTNCNLRTSRLSCCVWLGLTLVVLLLCQVMAVAALATGTKPAFVSRLGAGAA